VFDFLLKDALDILTISFVNFGFGEEFSDFSFLFLDSLIGKLFLLINEVDSLFVFVTHGIILE
jgi:hypothetical protein